MASGMNKALCLSHAGSRENRACCHLDFHAVQLPRCADHIDLFRQFYPQQKSVFRARNTNYAGKILPCPAGKSANFADGTLKLLVAANADPVRVTAGER